MHIAHTSSEARDACKDTPLCPHYSVTLAIKMCRKYLGDVRIQASSIQFRIMETMQMKFLHYGINVTPYFVKKRI